MTPPTTHDLFISYRRKDAKAVNAAVIALRDAGVKVFLDTQRIEKFDDFSAVIGDALVNAKAVLVWYGAEYSRSRACQWELTAAYLAGQREGDPRRRVWVVNPLKKSGHLVLPAELARQNIPAAPETDAELRQFAADLKSRLDSLPGALGDIHPGARPPWHGYQPVPAERFVGRLADMWQVHDALFSGSDTLITAGAPAVSAQMHGMGGVGKSLLAEEYALRFGAAWPGGVFWLRALGGDEIAVENGTLSAEQAARLETALQEQLDVFAARLGIPSGLDPAQRAAEFQRRLAQTDAQGRPLPFLWVVDDLPPGLDNDQFRAWLAPHPHGRTLFTTRSHEYRGRGKAIRLDVLPPQEALELLTAQRKPIGKAEKEAASRIAIDLLGCHPLALDVAGAALATKRGTASFADFAASLANPSRDELELAAQFANILPNGHDKSIAATLLRSVKSLPEAGKDFLRLAACLAPVPIPARLVVDAFRFAEFATTEEEETPASSDPDAAAERAELAMHQAHQASLATFPEKRKRGKPDDGARIVHALVRRTLLFHDPQPARRSAMAASAVAALNRILPQVTDIRTHQALEGEVAHARELARGREDLPGAQLMGWLGWHDYERGSYASARELFDRTLEIFRRVLGMEHPDTLTGTNNLAAMLSLQGDLNGARALQEQALEISRRVSGAEHPDTLTGMNNLAVTLSSQGNLSGARVLQEQVLEIRRRVLGMEHPGTLTSMNNLALTLRSQGDLDGARALQEQELEICRRVLGTEHPGTLASINNLASTLSSQGDLPGARALQEQVLEIHCRVLGEEHPSTLTGMNNLAETLSSQGDLPGARALQEQALKIRRRVLGEEHPATLTSISNLALTLSSQGNLAGARALQELVLEIRRRVLGKDHPDTLIGINNLALTLSSQGDLDGARTLHGQELEICRRVLGVEHPDTSISAFNLFATLLQREGAGKRAMETYRDNLAWLLQRDPASLGADQYNIQQQLQDFLRKVPGFYPPSP